ncbi:NPC1-like intracellular cholesterol transporter 1 [Caloenas nicobarica]|uniref:NPC1-like intracellular cholesterol transporter 1 n=1 Tax=Caloenas nicobarica TaxID=187106 RepID=UPI0032B82BDC
MRRCAALAGAVLGALLALAAPSLTPVHRAGYCAFYGECGRNPEVNVSLLPSNVPCVSNTPAREATGAFLSLLRAICPDLVRDGNETTFVCCNLAQLSTLRLNVALSGTVLARCPSCARNFANLHCNNVCSPDQSLFINVTRAVNQTAAEGTQLAVVEYQCFYQQDYADALFSSCHGVRLPATGGYALDTMCGRYGAQLCTTQRWLDFQGDRNNGLTPLQIDFQLVPNGTDPGDGIVPLASRAWRCDQGPGADEEPCSCQDCAESCPPVVAPTNPPPPFQLGSADGALVLGAVLFSLFAFIFIVALLCRCRRSKKDFTPQPAAVPAKGCSARLSHASHRVLAAGFRRWGTLVAGHPLVVLVVAAAAAGGLSAGLATLRLTTDPVELWSAPNSRARQEKAFYDQHFGPFLRTNQVIVTAPGAPGSSYDSVVFGAKNFSGVLSEPVLRVLLELQEQLAGATAQVGDREVTLSDICYAPLNPSAPALGDCCVNSVTQYFQNNGTLLGATATQSDKGTTGTVDWRDHLIYCVNSPLSFKDITALELSCMAEYGGPVFPYIAFGGYSGSEYTEAEALIITYSLNNFPRDDPRHQWVLGWESRFLEVVGEFQRTHSPNLSVAFMAERSLEDEINRTTGEDIPIFAVSYLVVFVYIALALGEYTTWRRVLVDSKVTLALGGIAVVLGAVFASMGLLALLGLPSSLIILEVVPFLVLAVGADNIFIFVQEYQQSQREPGETREQHIGRVLAQVAPSMLLCSLSEVICFLLGALSSMPAVRTFALTAALAIALDFLLQMSGFVALLALDARRQEAARFDVCCCCGLEKGDPRGPGGRLLRPLLRRYYTPVLLHPLARPVVVLLFLFLACFGLYLTLHVPVGLDQELAMPKDSYMLQYFSALNKYLEVGVPTYFVTTGGYNFSSTNGTNAICSSAGCDPDSLTQTIQYATRFPNVSYLAIPATSWVDDFLDWLNPTGRCCRIHQFGELAGQFCPSTSGERAPGDTRGTGVCSVCLDGQRRPTPEEFDQFLPWFLHDRPTLQCAKGGLGAYDTAVSMDANGTILASRFMAYQRPLRTSQEYTGALRAARALAEEITQTLRRVPGTPPEFTVFPYTVTYVYYEQYLTVVAEGAGTLALCLVPTFIVSFLLLGMDPRSSIATIITITMILLDTGGAMALWDVPYNAVALINLVAAVGISVEFVSHITCAFAHSTQPGRVARAAEATVNMGSKVVAGVAMTNLPGVAVLAFAKAQLIQIFFFRLNLIITLVGLAHGLVFLPVLLSYIGPGPRMPSGNTSGDMGQDPAGQDKGLALGNPYFKDKDQSKDKHKATVPTQD